MNVSEKNLNASRGRTTPFLIAPSILSADFASLAQEIEAVTVAGADWIHVDVMDGHFVPNLTIGPPVVKSLRSHCKLPLDCHLMIENPEKYVTAFAEAGANSLTIHIEATHDAPAVLKQIRDAGLRAGITLKPPTSISSILPLLPLVDLVLIMTVNPGFSGQAFMHEQIAKVAGVREELQRIGHTALIQVDGGVNEHTALLLQDADVLVAGNAVFKEKDYRIAIAKLKAAKKIVR